MEGRRRERPAVRLHRRWSLWRGPPTPDLPRVPFMYQWLTVEEEESAGPTSGVHVPERWRGQGTVGHEDEGHLSLRNLEWGPTMAGAEGCAGWGDPVPCPGVTPAPKVRAGGLGSDTA